MLYLERITGKCSENNWMLFLQTVWDKARSEQRRRLAQPIAHDYATRMELELVRAPMQKNKKHLESTKCFVWSGLRGSNPPPPPWQGGALPNELNPQNGASGRNRTNDTRIFSPLLYQLSYRGGLGGCFRKMATRMGLEPTTSSVTG